MSLLHDDCASNDRQLGVSLPEGLPVSLPSRGIDGPGNQIGILTRGQSATAMLNPRGVRRCYGICVERAREIELLLRHPSIMWCPVQALSFEGRVNPHAGVERCDRDIASKHQPRALPEQGAKSIGQSTSTTPMTFHQRNIGEQV